MSEEIIIIEWGAIPNVCKAPSACAFVPMIWVNGRAEGSTYSVHGNLREEARELARERAEDEASRFGGDWTITVRERV